MWCVIYIHKMWQWGNKDNSASFYIYLELGNFVFKHTYQLILNQ